MVVWLDADASPRPVREMVVRASQRLDLPAVLVANHRVPVPPASTRVHQVLVRPGTDVADRHIVENAREGDLAITADIPLAAELVEKGVHVLDPRGERYTRENIGERLSIRDFMASLRDTGVDTGGPSGFGGPQRKAFGDALDRTLTELLR
ncbi:MAG: YaiI/YqxD family protein [Gemmatimonadales bacterium]|nr:MAG: YaiI/YqxD family protein [Gemmatimonadales bacterium]